MTVIDFDRSSEAGREAEHRLPLAQSGLELDLLKTLVAIAETGSFQRAAKVVFRTPSAVSMQMKRLEDLIGRHIFTKEGRGVTLTVDGAELLAYARRILALADEALMKFRQATTEGRVRLGTPDDYAAGFLPSILARFAKTHPNVQVDVTCHPSFALLKLVEDNDIDIALVDVGCTGGSAHAVYRERLVWAGHRDGIAYKQRPLPLAVSFPSCGWRKHAIETLTAAGVAHRVAYSSHQYLGQLAAVQADLAVAPLSLSTINGDLVIIEDKDLPRLGSFEIDLKVAAAAKGPAVDALIHHIKQSFEQRAAALAA